MVIGGFLFLFFVALTGVSWWALDLPRPFYVHGVLLLAALPLMWAAMLHFVPVLTRSGTPARAWRMLPGAATVLALLMLAALGGLLPRHALLAAALLLAFGALALLVWMLRRARRAIGAPHSGLYWYVAALALLVAGLGAVFGMLLDPARFSHWYALHLHLNLFGWVGLTVLGTLPVLLPTCLSQSNSLREPNATFRLRIGLPWAVSGALAIALAAALRQPGLGVCGALVLMGLIALHWQAWLGFYGSVRQWPGPAVSLLLGSGFLLLLLATGIGHAFGLIGGVVLLPAFMAGFLLPTVLGALAQLLPVWRYPGPDSPARQVLARTLARGAGWRGGLCVLAGFGQLFASGPALVLAGMAVLWLLLAVLWAARPRAVRPPSGL